ncbi:MAG: hypothetical protein RL758_168 [Pseudomonadota bacterium]|jgi:putative sterol carrier protein
MTENQAPAPAHECDTEYEQRWPNAVTPAPAVGADDVRDAARYRWLKSLPGSSPNLRGMAIEGARTLKNSFSTPHAVYVAESIDGAIDAAMGTAKPPVQHNGGANG